jgi:hypothetical protein
MDGMGAQSSPLIPSIRLDDAATAAADVRVHAITRCPASVEEILQSALYFSVTVAA